MGNLKKFSQLLTSQADYKTQQGQDLNINYGTLSTKCTILDPTIRVSFLPNVYGRHTKLRL